MKSRDKISTDQEEVELLYYSIMERVWSLNSYLGALDTLVEGRGGTDSEDISRVTNITQGEDISRATNIPHGTVIDNTGKYDQEMTWFHWSKDVIPHLGFSFIMALISVFEDIIDDICNDIASRNKIPLSRNDLTGGVIPSFKKYLNTFTSFGKISDNDWKTIEAIYTVRNVIVHGGGDIQKAKTGSMKNCRFLARKKVGLTLRSYTDTIPLIWREANSQKNNNEPSIASKPSSPKERTKVKAEKKKETLISITVDFCEFALASIADLILALKEEHLNLVKGPRSVN